jgi:hypothetical protein
MCGKITFRLCFVPFLPRAVAGSEGGSERRYRLQPKTTGLTLTLVVTIGAR